MIAIVEQSFLQAGYQTVRNKVFTGGYITGHYGQLPEVEALQIEVRYPVYLDETQLEKGLGSELIDGLVQQTGLSRDTLLSRLALVLPETIDKLTPEGRLPT